MAALIFLFLNLVASFLKSKRWGNRAAEDRSLSNLLYLASIWVIPIIVAITFHEAAHGFVAHLLGDETAWRLGRVSFNPLKHIDPVGTILLPGFLLLLPCLPPTRVCGGRPPPGQTFFGRRGWVHRSVRLSCRWKAEQVSPTFPRGATRRALAPSATYPCCGCRMAQ